MFHFDWFVLFQLELTQAELNKLKYEQSFLQSEYQHERTQKQQMVDEMKLRYEAEVSAKRKPDIVSYFFGKNYTIYLSTNPNNL